MGEKIVGKKCEKRFFKFTNIVTKKWVEKTRETNFPETHEYCVQKMLGKNRRKKVRKKFLYSHEYRYQKMGGKKRAK